ncbi:hypothetical protein ABZX93_29880 [Streptomyces sp. NPDC006632]
MPLRSGRFQAKPFIELGAGEVAQRLENAKTGAAALTAAPVAAE